MHGEFSVVVFGVFRCLFANTMPSPTYSSEKAIVDYQEAEEALEIEHEKKEAIGQALTDIPPKPQIEIPPIPEPPSPPRLSDVAGLDAEKYEDHHPLYIPKGCQTFVEHMDRSCFHVVNGRYFGLLTGSIADPQFVGPHAQGVAGLNMTGATALATAQTGGTASQGAILTAPAQATTSNSQNALGKSSNSAVSKGSNKKTSVSTLSNSNGASDTKPPGPTKKKGNGPKATASASDLRKLVEEGGEFAEKIKTCII